MLSHLVVDDTSVIVFLGKTEVYCSFDYTVANIATERNLRSWTACTLAFKGIKLKTRGHEHPNLVSSRIIICLFKRYKILFHQKNF